MKNKNFWPGMLAAALIFGMTAVGCDDGNNGGKPSSEYDYTTSSISALGTWLTKQSGNTADTPYLVALNVPNIMNLQTTLNSAPDIYVSLDLSGSTFARIPDYAFNNNGSPDWKGCETLTGIILPNSVTSIGYRAFYQCSSLTSITIGNGITDGIGGGTFYDCYSLTAINVTAANTVYSSDNGVLYNKTKTIVLECPRGKTGAYVIPNSVTNIGELAFADCTKLTSVTIGNSVTSIGDHAFERCNNLTGIILPNSVTSIGNYAFNNCYSLTNVTIGNSVTSIGYGVFYNWDYMGGGGASRTLTSVTFAGTIPSSGFSDANNVFPGDLRDKFYATDSTNGTPGTYTRPDGTSEIWTKR